jgi:hypothetical protein
LNDNRNISKNLITVNLANHQKLFAGTFITDKLMYNATTEELNKLKKEELRLLRNAFFAR